MNLIIFSAGVLCFLLGLVHSILGERLIFKSKRESGKAVPSKPTQGLRSSHLRIIWATWHLVTIFGWGIGVILVFISFNNHMEYALIIDVIIIAMLLSSIIVAYATKWKHLGWLVLLLIAFLLWVDQSLW